MAASAQSCTVVRFEWSSSTVFSLWYRPEPSVPFQAGQFTSILIPGAGPGGRDLRRAYSIASPPEADEVELCIKVVEEGPGTSYLKGLTPGSVFRCMAPYGDFVYRTPRERRAVFLATGTGVAPFRSMIFSKAFRENPPVSSLVLFGARNESEILYEKEILATSTEWKVCLTRPSDDFQGFRGRITEWLRSKAGFPWAESDFYLCGSGEMIKEAREILGERGVAKESIHFEKYY